MKIKIIRLNGEVFMDGWYIKESDSGFYAKMSEGHHAYFKFPWKLFKYKIMEEK